MPEDRDRAGEQTGSSPGEFVLGLLGGVIVVALLGFLAYQAVAVRETGPALRVEIHSVEPVPEGFRARLRVHNDGGQTAEQVQLTGTLTGGAARPESAKAVISYVPPASHREASFVFRTDPRARRLVTGIAGYSTS